MKKVFSFVTDVIIILTLLLPCVYAADETAVSQVEELLQNLTFRDISTGETFRTVFGNSNLFLMRLRSL